MNKGFENLMAEKILEKEDNSISLVFTIPETSPYFDGHFPDYPVLPAVAQADIVINFADRYFNTGVALSKIKRMKFNKIISPSLTLLLKIEIKNDTLSFKINSEDESENYSGGTLILASHEEKI